MVFRAWVNTWIEKQSDSVAGIQKWWDEEDIWC